MSNNRSGLVHMTLNTIACAMATAGFISSCSFLLATSIFPFLRFKMPLKMDVQTSRPVTKAARLRPSKPALKTCFVEQRCTFRNSTRCDAPHSSSPSPAPLEKEQQSLRRSASSPAIGDSHKPSSKSISRLRMRPKSDPNPLKLFGAAKRHISQSPILSVFPMKRECACSEGPSAKEGAANDFPKRFKAVRRQTIGIEMQLKKTTNTFARLQHRATRTLSVNDGWDKLDKKASSLLRPFVDRRNTRAAFA